MERRQFLTLGLTATGAAIVSKALGAKTALAKAPEKAKAGGPTITDKDILKEGQPATIANYCEHPEKQPNKYCADWKSKPGHCVKCTFYNTDASETTYKGGKYAHCQLLNEGPKYVSEKAYCSTYVEKT